jgi:16S rRNA (uracil1498-N3)-methyltransferase
VLRLKTGDEIGLYDGKGLEYHARIASFSDSCVEALITNKLKTTSESPVKITVAQGFLKERKMDELVRQLTELGIYKWFPFIASRSVSRPQKKQLQNRMARWETISKQSIKQCERGKYIEIGETLSFEETLKAACDCDVKIVFWEENDTLLLKEIYERNLNKPVNSVFIMLGPEGGLTGQEIELAKSSGFLIASLGPRILRAETATLTACVLIQFLFGDMGKKTLTSK